MMLRGLVICGRALRHIHYQGYVYIWGNVLFFILSLPIVTIPAAWAGLVHMSYQAQKSPSAEFTLVWEGFKLHLRRGLSLGVINLIIIFVSFTNYAAYRQQSAFVFDLLRVLWALILLLWLTIQFYMWPLWYEMRNPTMSGAVRNAAVMLILNPLFTLGLWIGVGLIIVVSTVLAPMWLFLTIGTLAAVATEAVLDRLALHNQSRKR